MRLIRNSVAIALQCFAPLIFNMRPIAAQRGAPAEPLATVTIHVIDEYGVTVDSRLNSFANGQREMASHFRGLQGAQIPYGEYSYLIRRLVHGDFGEVIPGRVTVRWPENLVVVTVSRLFIPGAAIDRAAPRGLVIRGKLEPMPQGLSAAPLWIRLSPIHQSEHVDVSVDASGEFRIYKPLDGRYVLTVIRGDEVLDLQQISFDENWQPADFVLKLPDQPPSIVHVQRKQ